MDQYPRMVEPGFKPFDPLEVALLTEKIIAKNNSRKYTAFYCTGVYGGISTGYTVGCLLRCIFCWVSLSRDYPEDYGKFYTPQEVFENLFKNAKKARVSKLRISGGEPTLCKNHLLSVLDLIRDTDYLFILETNGIILGVDREYVKALKRFPNIHVRVSLKAGNAEGFEKRCGAQGKFYTLPYQAIQYLREEKIPFHVASMSDSRLMPVEERKAMLEKLKEVGYDSWLEEEVCDPYDTCLIRLEKAGWKIF